MKSHKKQSYENRIELLQGTLDLLKKHGFAPVYEETPGGHTWINWRNYLTDFAPKLFK